MCRSRRLLNFGLITTAALLAGAPPLGADNFTSIDSNGNIEDDSATFTEAITYDQATPDDPAHTLNKGVDNLVIGLTTAANTTFTKGVKIIKSDLDIQFNGSVTFQAPDPADPTVPNVLNIRRIAFNGSDDPSGPPAELSIEDAELNLGDSEVSIDNNFKVDFKNGGKLSEIAELHLGTKATTGDTNLSFGETTAFTAKMLHTGGPQAVIIAGAVQLGKAAAGATDIESGLIVTDSVTVNGQTTVNGKLSGGGGTNFIFKKDASIVLAQGAAGSELADNTKFQIHDDLLKEVILKETAVTAFKPFDTVKTNDPGLLNTFKLLAEGLALDDSNKDSIPGGGEMAYDPDSGYVVFASYGNREALSGVPGYGVPYVKALAEGVHPTLAIAIKGTAKAADVSAELNTLMGNVPNAAMAAALSDNMGQVMGHLNSTLSVAMPGFAGPSGAASGLWIAPGYSLTKVSGSPKDGYGDLEIKNPGVTLGYDRWVNDRIRLGVFAAMNQPKTEGDNETVDTDHMQAGLYGQARLNYGINVNMGLAYSRQSHDAERRIRSTLLAGYDQVVSSSFDSDALSAAVEVSRLYPLANNAFVRPTLGYSYVAASVDGFTEKSNNQNNNLAQKVKDTDFTMHLLRLGAEGGWSNDVTTVTGRLFWVGNMGDTQPRTQAALITNESMPFTLVGAEYDKNMVNIGLGVKYAPPQTRGLTLGLNYDALLGSNAKNHNLSLMVRYEF